MDINNNIEEIYKIIERIEKYVLDIKLKLLERKKIFDKNKQNPIDNENQITQLNLNIDAKLYKDIQNLKNSFSTPIEIAYKNFREIQLEINKQKNEEKQKSEITTTKKSGFNTDNNNVNKNKKIKKKEDNEKIEQLDIKKRVIEIKNILEESELTELINNNNNIFGKFRDAYLFLEKSKKYFIYDEQKKCLISKYAILISAQERLTYIQNIHYDINNLRKIRIDIYEMKEIEEKFFSPWLPLLIQESPTQNIKTNKTLLPLLLRETKIYCIFELAFLELKSIEEIQILNLAINNGQKNISEYKLNFPIDSYLDFSDFFEKNDILKNYKATPFYIHKEICLLEDFYMKMGLSRDIFSNDKQEFDKFSELLEENTKNIIKTIFKISPIIVFRMIPIFLYPQNSNTPINEKFIEDSYNERKNIEINKSEIEIALDIYESPINLFDKNENIDYINRQQKRQIELIEKIENHKRIAEEYKKNKNNKQQTFFFDLPPSYLKNQQNLKLRLGIKSFDIQKQNSLYKKEMPVVDNNPNNNNNDLKNEKKEKNMFNFDFKNNSSLQKLKKNENVDNIPNNNQKTFEHLNKKITKNTKNQDKQKED